MIDDDNFFELKLTLDAEKLLALAEILDGGRFDSLAVAIRRSIANHEVLKFDMKDV